MLITGGTGAFGQAFVQRCLDRGYHRICVYSRDEYKQAKMREKFGTDKVRYFIGDVRDKERLRRAMRGCSTIIHAAALKRIEVGHYNPCEMIKTNVLGTMNIVEACQDVPSVRRVVYLSTDKAWQPVSAYGQSKALAESLILAANDQVGQTGPKFVVTRYGNVAGSTGSVIPMWRSCIEEGRPITISDPEVTRFYMTMDEACDLVEKAITTDEKLLIPKLPAYRLGDLLRVMMRDIEPQPEVITTKLGEYEKLHEGMAEGNTSDLAHRMTDEEIRTALGRVG
jgi:UDP-N-acetylglucosamine 4,6-dehydratase